MPVQFGPSFLKDPARADVRRLWYERIAASRRLGAVRAAGGVIERPDYSGRLGGVRLPTLVVAGEADAATPPDEARRLHALIAGSELVIVPGAGHAVPIEDPAAVNLALDGFLARNRDRLGQDS